MRQLAAVLGSMTLAAVAVWPQTADACGGFFCQTTPIDQSGENIVFDIRDGKVDAHVQIQYEGEAKDFAWVVPVHGIPNLRVGAPGLFTWVAMRTNPQFNLQMEENSCGWFNRGGGLAETASAGQSPSADDGVTVLAQGQVGPYDSAIVAANDVNELATWLRDNGFNLQDSRSLEPYVGNGYNFLALKLQQDRTAGELRPIVIEFGGSRPCIPIMLTAVAARPDMPIRAYVFAQNRAVPINYRHVLINESRIDWLNFGSNYTQVASRAVDEAGGQAFLTEFAGKTTTLQNPPDWVLPGPNLNTQALAQHSHPVEFTEALFAQNFPRGDSAILALFQKYIPLPKSLEGKVEVNQFYNGISQYRADIDNDPGRIMFDPAGFAAELQTSIVEPLLRAHELLKAQPYMTRLYTTMSAEEMTLDPEFEFNPDAPDVSNVHNASGKITCGIDGKVETLQITLADGRTFYADPNGGAIPDGPFAQRVEQYAEIGAPALIKDNTRAIDDVLVKYNGGCGGCGAGGAAPLSALALGALAFLGRRRRTV